MEELGAFKQDMFRRIAVGQVCTRRTRAEVTGSLNILSGIERRTLEAEAGAMDDFWLLFDKEITGNKPIFCR